VDFWLYQGSKPHRQNVMPHWHQGPQAEVPPLSCVPLGVPLGVPITPRPRPYRRWSKERDFPFSSVQSLYVVDLKLSLCRRLARYTHARRMRIYLVESSIARQSFGSADTGRRRLAGTSGALSALLSKIDAWPDGRRDNAAEASSE
jgi:hypothetical protein